MFQHVLHYKFICSATAATLQIMVDMCGTISQFEFKTWAVCPISALKPVSRSNKFLPVFLH